MGRDWYWGSGAKTSSSNSRRAAEIDSGGQTTPSGCISAVFHLFDFHHFQFPLNHQTGTSSCNSCFKPDSFLSPDPITTLKGVEAPRNSLESEEEGSTSASASLPSTSKEEEILNIPMGIQIKTSGDKGSKVGAPNNDTSSEISSSPGTKTPTLVARLMGLDLLPESRSPSFSFAPNFHAKSHLNHHHIQSRNPLQSKTTGHRNSLDGDFRGTLSLPETPRISSSRRSDVDHHHRLSLQINKENMSASEELVISRLFSLKKKELKHVDDNRSPGHYARDIVKQVKENVSRKVGMDITNTVRNREQDREEFVSQFKYKKISRALTKVGDDLSPAKHSTPSCSPRLRFLESKSKPAINSCTKDRNSEPSKPLFSSSSVEIDVQHQPIYVLPKPKLQPVEEEQVLELQVLQQQLPRAASKGKKGSSEKFRSRLKKPQQTSDIIRNKQEEPFVRPSTANRVNIPDKKCRKTLLSNNLLNNITVPTLLPVKKDPSPPATKIPQKQVSDAQRPKRISSQLSSCSSQTYKKQETHVHVVRDNTNIGDICNDAAASTGSPSTGDDEAAEYYEYISRILRRTGLDKDTPVSFTSWFSPSHPLDPSIFYYLEHFTTCSTMYNDNNNYKTNKSSQLRHRCNRKLLFHLVDEILVKILKPHFNLRPWVITVGHDFISHMDGSRLTDTLCSKIRSFPQADCRVLEDIDALIDKDLPEMKHQNAEAFDEEGEGIVTEIERDILESLVHETAVDFVARL